MSRQNTKRLISDTFIRMVKESSFNQVRVASLIETCGISRTGFYYHFTNKVSIAMWVFRTSLAHALRNNLPESKLISTPIDKSGSDTLPYYVHDEIGGHALDASLFYISLAECIQTDARFYKGLLIDPNREFINQVFMLYSKAVSDDIAYMLGTRYMPEPTQHILVHYVVMSVVTLIEYVVTHEKDVDILVQVEQNPFWNLVHESMHAALLAHPVQRRA